jgi:hypothetical protein
MAEVRLGRSETENNQLPAVCMRCGSPATVRVDKNFAWHPPWVWLLLPFGLIPALVLDYLLTKRVRASAPLCRRHKNHWEWYSAGIFFSFVIILIGAGVVYVFLPKLSDQVMIAGLAGALLLWLVTSLFLYRGSIRAKEITDNNLTLTNVAEGFVAAVQNARPASRPQQNG